MKKIGLLFLTLLTGATLISCGSNSSTPTEKLYVGMEGTIKVYNEETPYSSEYTLAVSGKHETYIDGYDVQIAKSIGEKLNKEIIVIEDTKENLNTKLEDGTINCIISDLSLSPENKLLYDFTSPYYTAELVLITKKEIADRYTTSLSKDELKTLINNQTIISERSVPSYYCIDGLVESCQAIKGTSYPKLTYCIAEVLDSNAFAFTCEAKDTAEMLKKSSDIGVVRFEQSATLNDYADLLSLGVAVKKDNTELKNQLSDAINQISNEDRKTFMEGAISRANGNTSNQTNIFQDVGFLLRKYGLFFLYGTISTIVLSTFGTLVGLLFGVFLALGKRLKPTERDNTFTKILKKIVVVICHIYSTVIRGTPMMVQAMIFKYGCQAIGINWNLVMPGNYVFNGWFIAGIVVITLNTTAYMGEIVLSGLNGVDPGQNEGARSLGLTSGQTLRKVILPQAIRNAIPTIGNEWIVNIKDSSVLNVISVSELFFQAISVATKGYKFMATYLIIAVIYLLLTLCTTFILKMVERKLDGKPFKFSFKSFKLPMFHFRNKEAK